MIDYSSTLGSCYCKQCSWRKDASSYGMRQMMVQSGMISKVMHVLVMPVILIIICNLQMCLFQEKLQRTQEKFLLQVNESSMCRLEMTATHCRCYIPKAHTQVNCSTMIDLFMAQSALHEAAQPNPHLWLGTMATVWFWLLGGAQWLSSWPWSWTSCRLSTTLIVNCWVHKRCVTHLWVPSHRLVAVLLEHFWVFAVAGQNPQTLLSEGEVGLLQLPPRLSRPSPSRNGLSSLPV